MAGVTHNDPVKRKNARKPPRGVDIELRGVCGEPVFEESASALREYRTRYNTMMHCNITSYSHKGKFIDYGLCGFDTEKGTSRSDIHLANNRKITFAINFILIPEVVHAASLHTFFKIGFLGWVLRHSCPTTYFPTGTSMVTEPSSLFPSLQSSPLLLRPYFHETSRSVSYLLVDTSSRCCGLNSLNCSCRSSSLNSSPHMPQAAIIDPSLESLPTLINDLATIGCVLTKVLLTDNADGGYSDTATAAWVLAAGGLKMREVLQRINFVKCGATDNEGEKAEAKQSRVKQIDTIIHNLTSVWNLWVNPDKASQWVADSVAIVDTSTSSASSVFSSSCEVNGFQVRVIPGTHVADGRGCFGIYLNSQQQQAATAPAAVFTGTLVTLDCPGPRPSSLAGISHVAVDDSVFFSAVRSVFQHCEDFTVWLPRHTGYSNSTNGLNLAVASHFGDIKRDNITFASAVAAKNENKIDKNQAAALATEGKKSTSIHVDANNSKIKEVLYDPLAVFENALPDLPSSEGESTRRYVVNRRPIFHSALISPTRTHPPHDTTTNCLAEFYEYMKKRLYPLPCSGYVRTVSDVDAILSRISAPSVSESRPSKAAQGLADVLSYGLVDMRCPLVVDTRDPCDFFPSSQNAEDTESRVPKQGCWRKKCYTIPGSISIPFSFPYRGMPEARKSELWMAALLNPSQPIVVVAPNYSAEVVYRTNQVYGDTGIEKCCSLDGKRSHTREKRKRVAIDGNAGDLFAELTPDQCAEMDIVVTTAMSCSRFAAVGCFNVMAVIPHHLLVAWCEAEEEKKRKGSTKTEDDSGIETSDDFAKESTMNLVTGSTLVKTEMASAVMSAPSSIILDCRSPYEFQQGSHYRAVHIPLNEMRKLATCVWSRRRGGGISQEGPTVPSSWISLIETLYRHHDVEQKSTTARAHLDAVVVIYCAAGYRSHVSKSILHALFELLASSSTGRPMLASSSSLPVVVDLAGGALQLMLRHADDWTVKDRNVICIS